jgi:hypothetical protein
MLTFPMLPGVEVNVFLLAFMGFAVGAVGSFIGGGGGYLLTPALIVLGIPGSFAAGTGVLNIAGMSVISALRHRGLGNVDMKLGLLLLAGVLGGTELGVRLVNYSKARGLSSEAVLLVSVVLLTAVGIYTVREVMAAKRRLDEMLARTGTAPRDVTSAGMSRRVQALNIPPRLTFETSRTTISLWVVLLTGFLTGLVSGFMGIGGAFILIPALVYLFGVPSHVAVGTGLFQIAFSSSYGALRHGMSGNVLILVAVVMVLGASVGAQIGTLGTRYVRGPSVRGVLGFSVIVGALGAAFKLADALAGGRMAWLQLGAQICTFGGMGLLIAMIAGLLVMAFMYRRGLKVPKQFQSLLVKEE